MPQEKIKIFLSAVTGQFKTCRDALRSDLSAVGAEVIVQEDFQQGGGTLLEKLERYINSCDRVIVLVGNAYGWSPDPVAIPDQAPSRSYSQWEYYFARGERLNGTQAAAKPVYAYFAMLNYLEQFPVEQSKTEAQSQQQFIREIIANGKDRNQFDSIDKLRLLVLRDGFKLSSAGNRSLQNLPYDSLGTLFKGRDDFISAIRANLSSDSSQATAIVTKQVIHGLGGVGKTRLAVEYAWHCLSNYSACLFVTADSRENLERNLAELSHARVLNLPEQSMREQELQVSAVLRWLEQQSGWLLILDNIDTPEAAKAVEQLLPALQNGHVLITSRLTDWSNNIESLALDTLSEDDAVDFLLEITARKRKVNDADASAVRTLAKILGGLALALEQAGAFINKMHISLPEYQQRWIQQETKLRNFPVKHYPRPLAITWETSFEQLTPAAQALLNLLCWFAPEPIPREPFAAAFSEETLALLIPEADLQDKAETRSPDLEDLLEELESLSLLKWTTDYSSFSIHRLVQEITQVRLGDNEHQQSLLAAIGLINQALPDEPPPNDIRVWSIWDPLRPHIEKLIHTADKANITDPTVRLLNDLGQYLEAKGLFGEAEPLMRRVVEILLLFKIRTGHEHPHLNTAINNYRNLLAAMGQNEVESTAIVESLIESVKSKKSGTPTV